MTLSVTITITKTWSLKKERKHLLVDPCVFLRNRCIDTSMLCIYMYVLSYMTSPKDVAGIFGPFFRTDFFQLSNPPTRDLLCLHHTKRRLHHLKHLMDWEVLTGRKLRPPWAFQGHEICWWFWFRGGMAVCCIKMRRQKRSIEPPKKNLTTFHCTGCLIGILIMV